jgi:hypothetical protein
MRPTDVTLLPTPQPLPSGQGQVADALDNLADQIRQAATVLRCPEPQPASVRARQLDWYEPRSVVDLVMYELSQQGIKSEFGPEADLASAERSAALLLSALGVAVPDAQQAAGKCDPAG